MPNMNELYVRKSRSSNPTIMSDSEDQMWDDSSMTAAYDKAVSKANAEIAKQIAMATNTKLKDHGKSNDKKGKGPKTPKSKVWKEGMPCRAVYCEDGQEYEAIVYAVLDDSECVVRFLGYDNSEIVNIDSLKESRGEEPRLSQIEQARSDKQDDGFESQSNEERSTVTAHQLKEKKSSKKKHRKIKNPDLCMPNIPDLLSLNSNGSGPWIPNVRVPKMPFMPPPPPPPPGVLSASGDPEDQALTSMLISWYMSGYHTGLYQGMKKSRVNRRHYD